KGPGDQRGGNDRKHHLIDHKSLMGNRGSIVGVRFRADSVQAQPVEISDDSTYVGSEGESITPEDPLNTDQGDNNKTLHKGAEDILPSDQAAVEKKETWNGHHQDQSGRGEHPRV